jgi:3'-5' exoribonuclease
MLKATIESPTFMGVKQPISSLRRDMRVDDSYAVKYRNSVVSYAKGYRFELVVQDRSATIALKYWGGVDEQRVRRLHAAIHEGGVVHVVGVVVDYNGKLELHVNENVGLITPAELVHVQDFIPSSGRDPTAMLQEYCDLADSIAEPTLKAALADLLTDDVKKRLLLAPGAEGMHHARLGGLLEHTLQLAAICEECCRRYPRLNRDLLIAGCLIHDLGKLEEYRLSGTILSTPERTLVGHIALTTGKIMTLADTPGMDRSMLLKLAHMVVSHHSTKEWGSPKPPAIPEAVVLSQLDKMDANVDRMFHLLDEIAAGREGDKDKDTFYDKMDGRLMFLK